MTMLREHNVRNHPLDGGPAVLVAEDQGVILVPGARGTASMVNQEEALEEWNMAQKRLFTSFPFWKCSMTLRFY